MSGMKWIFAVLLVCLIGLVPVFGAGTQESAVVESKELSVITCSVESEAIEIFKQFEKETGIKVKYIRLSAGECLTRLGAEKENPQVSLWLGGASDDHMNAVKQGLLDNYVSKNTSALDPAILDPEQHWTPYSFVVTAFVSNDKWLAEKGLKAPTSWAELLDPVFKDNVCYAHPATSGAAFRVLSGVLQLMGEEKGFEYLEKLDENIVQYTKAGAAPMRMAGLGETGVAIGYDLDGLYVKNEGYPLTVTYPSEGTGWEASCVSIIKGGPATEKKNAGIFIDWLLGETAQKLLCETFYRIPVNQNTKLPAGMKSLSEINIIDYDCEWASTNRVRIIKQFDSQVRNHDNVLK